ncbi:MAG: hypothetical protein RBQ72_01370 [Desulfobacterium sp.]|jgi:ABC-type transporter Mla subunit MlaD|nr:hypothetical protein [Desulfobacterium sp.]
MGLFQKITLIIISAFFLILMGCNTLGLTVNFKELHGLTQGAPVILDYTVIGRVKEILPLKNGTYPAALEIDPDFKTLVTDHSTFTLVPEYKGQDLIPRTIVMVNNKTPGGSPLTDGSIVEGFSPTMMPEVSKTIKKFAAGFEAFKEKIGRIPETDEYKQFEQSIDELAQNMKESGEEIKEQIRNEILPKIEQEFEAFKQRLKDLQNQNPQDQVTQPELEPLEQKLNNLREI